jgi:hypothetical protein
MSQDIEIQAMMDISKALSELEPEAVSRVLRWAADRYQAKFLGTAAASRPESESNGSSAAQRFEDFASLYDAANPPNAVERALVAAYWFQAVQGDVDFDALSLNKEVKHLGHLLTNITRDLDALINRTPRLVIQVRKSGNSKQARKKYKLTTEGRRAVERMLNGGSVDGE